MWTHLTQAPPGAVTAVAVHPDGSVFAVIEQWLYVSRDRGDSWHKLQPCTVLAISSAGELAIGAGGVALSADGGASWQPAPPLGTEPPGTPTDGMHRLLALGIAPDGELWTCVRSDSLSFYPADVRGPGHPPIHHAAGIVKHALYRTAGGRQCWKEVGNNQQASDFAFAGDDVWIAGGGGLHRFTAPHLHIVVAKPCRCVAVTGDGWVIAGTHSHALASKNLEGDPPRAGQGQAFEPMPSSTRESGDWGSMSLEANGFSALVPGPGGSVWASTNLPGCAGVFELEAYVKKKKGKERPLVRWRSHNVGLFYERGVGTRPGTFKVNDVAVGADGTGYAATASHGLFRHDGLYG